MKKVRRLTCLESKESASSRERVPMRRPISPVRTSDPVVKRAREKSDGSKVINPSLLVQEASSACLGCRKMCFIF